MQKTSEGAARGAGITYRERLTPSLPLFVAAAMVGPMAGMVFVPFVPAVALIIGAAVTAAVIALLVRISPRIEVCDGILRVGPARIPVELLGTVQEFTGQDARYMRGPGLQVHAWHLIRGGIDGLARIEVIDPLDPAPAWFVSTRTPDRLAAAIRRAQTTA